MAIGVFGFSQSDETHVSLEQQLPFKAGEWFEFRIHYGFFNASYATLELSQDTLNGVLVLHAKGYGTTTGLARWFFKVEDYYDTYFDEKKVVPYWFVRDINEGGYTKNLEINFDHDQNLAHVSNLENNKKEPFFEEIEKSLWSYFSNKFNVSSADLSKETINDFFAKNSISEDVSKNFTSIIEKCEFCRFAPSSLEAEDMNNVFELATKVIVEVEQDLKK